MDWSKLNMKEVNYYCKYTDFRFDCLIFSMQIESLIMLLYHYQIDTFTIKDIQEFYKKMQIPKFRSDGIIKPTPKQIQKAIAQHSFIGVQKNIQSIKDDSYKIIFIDTKFYTDEIQKGYLQNRIK